MRASTALRWSQVPIVLGVLALGVTPAVLAADDTARGRALLKCEALLEELRSAAVDPTDPEVDDRIESCALSVDGFLEAFQRYVTDFARDTAETASRAAQSSLDLDRPEEALERFQKAYGAYRQADDAPKVAETLTEMAELHRQLGDAEAAWEASREAARVYEESGVLESAADAWKLAASAGEEMDAPPSVTAASRERAAALYQSTGAHGSAGALLLRVGRSRMDELGDIPGALAAFRRARRNLEATGDAIHAIHALALEGEARSLQGQDRTAEAGTTTTDLHRELSLVLSEARHYRQLGDLEAALAEYRSARKVLESEEEPGLIEAGLWLKEGELFSALGRPGPEILAYRQARRSALERNQPLSAARAWAVECEALGALGEGERMEECLGEAEATLQVDLDELPGDPPWQHLVEKRAERYWSLGPGEKVIEIFQSAEFPSDIAAMSFFLRFWRGMFDASWEPALGFLAELPDDALGLFREARQLLETEDQPLEAAQMGILEAVILTSRGRSEEALRILSEVEASTRDDRFANGLWHFVAAVVHEARGRAREARHYLRQSLPWFRSRRTASLTRWQRGRSIEWLFPFSQRLVRELHEEGRAREALLEAEAARTRAFLDVLANAALRTPAGGEVELEARRRSLEEDLAAVEVSLQTASPAERRNLVERRNVLDRELDEIRFESALRRGTHPGAARRIHLGELDAVVEAVGPILYYFVTDLGNLGFLLLPNEDVSSEVVALMHWHYLEDFAERFTRLLANPLYEDRAYDEGREWWDHLIGPFADRLPPDGPLTIVPHGPLHSLPFSALVSPEGQYLGEQYRLSISPSLSALHELVGRDRPADPDERLLALASGRGLGLPLTEVREVSKLFDPERVTLLGPEEATFVAYRSRAPEAQQLLIASRAVASPGRQRLTYVELEGDRSHDSRLTAVEIASIPLEAELVTLAACDTARAEPLLSDEHLDLSRAFLLAGSTAVLATRWKLPEDYRTSLFVQNFYRMYRTGGPHGRGTAKGEALRRVRSLSRERGDPAQVWAAWVLVGDGR